MPTQLKHNATFVLIISCLVLGLIVGTSSALLSLFLDFIEQTFLNFVESNQQPAAISTLPTHRLISVLLGGIIAAIIWAILRTKFRPTVSIARALKGENMPLGQTVIHVVTQIFYVGTGGSVGRELAPREAGAMFAQKWEQLLAYFHLAELSAEDKKLLIAAAAGAGFAGVYIAPITGMFFCVEILLKKVNLRTVSVSLVMSSIAMLIGSLVKGFKPYYLVHDVKFSVSFVLLASIIGLLCGIMEGLFRRSFQWAEQHQTKNKQILWQLPVMAAVTGGISMIFPQIMGNGRALAQIAFSGTAQKMLLLLALRALAKALVTVLTIRSGAAGGTLTPAISIGASLGGIFALIAGLPLEQSALLGATALLASAQQAPLMALFMMIEICHLGSDALLPLGLAVVLATVSSQVMLKKS